MFFYALETNMDVDLFGFTIFMIFRSKIKMSVHDSINVR